MKQRGRTDRRGVGQEGCLVRQRNLMVRGLQRLLLHRSPWGAVLCVLLIVALCLEAESQTGQIQAIEVSSEVLVEKGSEYETAALIRILSGGKLTVQSGGVSISGAIEVMAGGEFLVLRDPETSSTPVTLESTLEIHRGGKADVQSNSTLLVHGLLTVRDDGILTLSAGATLQGNHITVLPRGRIEVETNATTTLGGAVEVLRGGGVHVEQGGVLYLAGELMAGRYQIFLPELGGTVARSTGSPISVAYPEWWGAQPSPQDDRADMKDAAYGVLTKGSAEADAELRGWTLKNGTERVDCTDAIQHAIEFVRPGPVPTTVSFSRGFYLCSGELTVVRDAHLCGTGDTSTTLLHIPMIPRIPWDDPHRAFISVEPIRTIYGRSTVCPLSTEIRNLRILGDYDVDRDPTPPTSVTGLHLDRASGVLVENVDISGFRDASILISYGCVNSFRDVNCTSSGAGIRIEGQNPDLVNWAYWLPPTTVDTGFVGFAAVASDFVVINRASAIGGNPRYHYVAVQADGAVLHRRVIPQDQNWLACAVECKRATLGIDQGRDDCPVVEGYFGEIADCEGEPTPWVIPLGEAALPDIQLDDGESVVDIQCTALGQRNVFWCFCLLSSGKVLLAQYTDVPGADHDWHVVPFLGHGHSLQASSNIPLATCSLSEARVELDSDDEAALKNDNLFSPVQWDKGTEHLVAFTETVGPGGQRVILHAYRPGWAVAEGSGPNAWYATRESLPPGAPEPAAGDRPALATGRLCINPHDSKDWSEILFLAYRSVEGALCVLQGTSQIPGDPYDWTLEETSSLRESLAAHILLGPTSIAPQNGRFDLFVTDESGRIWQRTWAAPDGWFPRWVDVSEGVISGQVTDPEAVPVGVPAASLPHGSPRVIDPTSVAFTVTPPAVTSGGPDHIDLFALNQSGRLFRRRYSGRWYDWEAFQGTHNMLGIAPPSIVCAGGRDGEVVWVHCPEGSGTVTATAHWRNSITTTQSFTNVRAATCSIGFDIEDGHQITLDRATLEGNAVAASIDHSSLVTLSNGWFESNSGHAIEAGRAGLVQGLQVDLPNVVGHAPGATRSVVWLDKVIWADIELIRVANPFKCWVSTTPNSHATTYRDPAGGLPLMLKPGYWCYGCGGPWGSYGPASHYSSESDLCSRFAFCSQTDCLCGYCIPGCESCSCQADLVVGEVKLDPGGPESEVGKPSRFLVTIRNQGCYDAAGFEVSLQGSANAVETGVPFLRAGMTMTLGMTLEVSTATETFLATVDSHDLVGECEEGNNTYAISISSKIPLAPLSWSCPCLVNDEPTVLGRRLPLRDGVVEVGESEALFVANGWSGDDCGLAENDYCRFTAAHQRFDLSIDGVTIEPTYVSISEGAVEVGCTEEGWRGPYTGWGVMVIYEFPSGYFEPGTYHLTGTWSMIDYPQECMSEERASCLCERYDMPIRLVGEDSIDFDQRVSLTLEVVRSARPD